jgi:hypothetical protein
VEENAFLDACVLADDAYVEPGADVFGSVVTAATPRPRPAPAISVPSREDHQPALQPWTLPQAVSRPR